MSIRKFSPLVPLKITSGLGSGGFVDGSGSDFTGDDLTLVLMVTRFLYIYFSVC